VEGGGRREEGGGRREEQGGRHTDWGMKMEGPMEMPMLEGNNFVTSWFSHKAKNHRHKLDSNSWNRA
jgi:hypothetical protein